MLSSFCRSTARVCLLTIVFLNQAVTSAEEKEAKPAKLFRPRSGQSNRKGMPHHHAPRPPPRQPPATPAGLRPLEVHVLGAASQEETLLPTYYPEIGLLFPELSIRECILGGDRVHAAYTVTHQR